MDAFFESPMPAIVVGVTVEGILVFLYMQSGKSALLKGMAAVLALTAGGVVAQNMIVTDREALNATIDTVVQALLADDKPTVLNAIEPGATALRREAERVMGEGRITKLEITGREIKVHGHATPRTAEADVIVKLAGRARGIGSGEYIGRFRVDFVRTDDGRWLATGYEQLDVLKGTPIGGPRP